MQRQGFTLALTGSQEFLIYIKTGQGGNRMFCVKCGNKMADESVFCPQCGTKVGDSGTVTASKQEGVYSKELDKRALKIYLKNVLVLECIVHKLNEQMSALDKKIKNLKSYNYFREFDIENSLGRYQFFYNGQDYLVKIRKWGGCVDASFFEGDSTGWVDVQDVLSRQNKKGTWYSGRYLVENKVSVWRDVTGGMKFNHETNVKKKAFLKCYKEFQETAPIEHEKNRQTLSEWGKNYETLSTKRKEVSKLLNDAYKINIVPGTMRNNLSAIYYLYDIVSTSSLSFEMAILNFNLEEIKARLDKVIQKQQESIINQARMIAQNDNICAQNDKMLKSIAAVELNTEYAAKYSQIAASNTDSLVWLARHTV